MGILLKLLKWAVFLVLILILSQLKVQNKTIEHHVHTFINSKEVQQKIEKLQTIEQNMQQFLMQKQQFQTQLVEIESALKELEKTTDSYKIIGNIMVKTSKEELKKDLEGKKELVDLRIKTVEKQENKIKGSAEELRKEIMGKLEGGKK